MMTKELEEARKQIDEKDTQIELFNTQQVEENYIIFKEEYANY